jgi:hypothetical protein
MPKEPSSRAVFFHSARLARIEEANLVMPSPCGRCKEKGLGCKIELTTGFCVECIRARVQCDLFLTNAEWGEIKDGQQKATLRVARAEAELAVAKVILLEAQEKESRRVLEDIASTEKLEKLEEAAGIRAIDAVPITDSGWSQAIFTLFTDPSFLDLLPGISVVGVLLVELVHQGLNSLFHQVPN